ncbi:hypothetical protein PCH_Pc12g14260 [Penicillium rubens Wisconsin 54-1255]|uniref:Uncharacterized protein n=1 Tax=Penicillium rubens (strain ATCC 28089 / DSM 1075 / NRRL 1951 / Wisconsin 54-1255) TaxID=500485 RepID=B6H0T5_PENRW|nr:hypothetical protein PCH_Pc12g14260 [Penicillium rubens Wisconsin 54-1255]
MSQRYAGLSIKSPPLAEKCGLVSAMMSLSHLPAYSKFSRTAAKWIRAKSTGNHKIKTNLQDVAKDYIHSFPEYANALDSDWKNSLPLKRTMSIETSQHTSPDEGSIGRYKTELEMSWCI